MYLELKFECEIVSIEYKFEVMTSSETKRIIKMNPQIDGRN